jgi:hypothetical protein
MQVLAVDGTDYEAITEIEELAVERYMAKNKDNASGVANNTEVSMRQANLKTVEHRFSQPQIGKLKKIDW